MHLIIQVKLREEHKLRVSDNRMLRRILGTRTEEVDEICNIPVGIPEGRDHSEYMGVYVKIRLEWILGSTMRCIWFSIGTRSEIL
jgi:hypothetical protein